MGMIRAATVVPFLLFGLVVGAWVDRLPKRKILAVADVSRGLLLATIPAAAALGILTVWWLIATAFLVGTMTVVFDVGYQAFLPMLVANERLVDANGKLQMSVSATAAIGPGLAGALVQAIGAPLVILADSCSYLVSAAAFVWMRSGRSPHARRPQAIRSDIREGMAFVFHNPVLRAGMLWIGLFNLCNSATTAIFVLYLVRALHLTPPLIGGITTVSALGFLIGAALVGRTVNIIGIGYTQVLGLSLITVGLAVTPLAAGPTPAVVVELALGGAVLGTGMQLGGISWQSLRQAVTPSHLQSRTLATFRSVAWIGIPVGALAGGVIAQTFGLQPTLWTGVAGSILALMIVYFSQIRHIRHLPSVADSNK
jgi:MFS family permease